MKHEFFLPLGKKKHSINFLMKKLSVKLQAEANLESSVSCKKYSVRLSSLGSHPYPSYINLVSEKNTSLGTKF